MKFSRSQESGGVWEPVMVYSWDQLGSTDRCLEDWGGSGVCLFIASCSLQLEGEGLPSSCRLAWMEKEGQKDVLCPPSPLPGLLSFLP